MSSCATTGESGGGSEAIAAALAAGDRDPNDVALDGARRPGDLFRFAGLQPGMRALELVSGTGYNAEIMSRIVGGSGQVTALNPPELLALAPVKGLWEARKARYQSSNLAYVDGDLKDLGGAVQPGSLDFALIFLNYHDLGWMKYDRGAVNKAVFDALKPGGKLLVVDHSAVAGAGDVGGTLHRIEEALVISELRAAGFSEPMTNDLLRNASDARDWDPNPFVCGERCGTSDRFVLLFSKP
jgi:predicted methyltransferase